MNEDVSIKISRTTLEVLKAHVNKSGQSIKFFADTAITEKIKRLKSKKKK